MSSYGDRNERERSTWPNKLEYQLSLFSYVLGLCTFWRFPYLAYENHGGNILFILCLNKFWLGNQSKISKIVDIKVNVFNWLGKQS